jgi:hypothetical protein
MYKVVFVLHLFLFVILRSRSKIFWPSTLSFSEGNSKDSVYGIYLYIYLLYQVFT